MSIVKTSVQHLPRVRMHTGRKIAFVHEQQNFSDGRQKKNLSFYFVEIMFLIYDSTKRVSTMQWILCGPANRGQLCRRGPGIEGSHTARLPPQLPPQAPPQQENTLDSLLSVIKMQTVETTCGWPQFTDPWSKMLQHFIEKFQTFNLLKLKKNVQILWPGKFVSCYLPASVSISPQKQNH